MSVKEEKLPASCPNIDDFLEQAQKEAEDFRKEKLSLLGQQIVIEERLKFLESALSSNAASTRSVQDAIAAYRDHLMGGDAAVPAGSNGPAGK